MNAHTPGPWAVFTDNREDLGGLVYVAGYNITANGQTVVGEEGICSSGNGEANARLIAAAPDLLEALSRYSLPLCMDYERDCFEFGKPEVDRELARRAAIAKATGEAA